VQYTSPAKNVKEWSRKLVQKEKKEWLSRGAVGRKGKIFRPAAAAIRR
jgi:hypothetical protein